MVVRTGAISAAVIAVVVVLQQWAGWWLVGLVLTVAAVLAVVGALVVAVAAAVFVATFQDTYRRAKAWFRTMRATSDPQAAELEDEVAANQARLDDLLERIREHTVEVEALAALSRQQTDLMQTALALVVDRSDRKAFWQQLAMNLCFFSLGVATTLVTS